MDEGVKQLVIDQVTEAQSRYPNLELLCYPSGELWVRGCVGFSMEYESRTIEDHYLLDLRDTGQLSRVTPFRFRAGRQDPKGL